jgi:tRNA A-37 threonylcarbamoyl transferase component Bud32
MSFNIGESVGPYRIIEQLGQGGMATVYKAYHAALDRYVAIKVLHPAFNEDQSFEARFQREARVVAKLEHSHIVPVYDYAEQEHRPYLVMKFIEGETLKARLARGPLTADEINKVVDTIGPALGYAHKQGILHRDIKPSNVLIGMDGEMYLADFGLARIAQAGESTLSSDSIMGTPQYISPEQAMGKKDLNEGTDIYSYGVMLYELVVGQVPFNADTPFSIIHDHIYTPLPMPRDINPKVPETVQKVLLKALSKEPADRYTTVNELIKAFKEAWAMAGVPMQGTAITLPKTVGKPAAQPEPVKAVAAQPAGRTVAAKRVPDKKRSPWMFIAGAVVLLLFCGIGFAVLRSGRFGSPLGGAGTSTSASITSTPVTEQTATEPGETSVPVTPTAVSPEIAAALLKVQQEPNNPDAHLALSLAYLDAELMRQSLESLNQAANLAGQDRQFFLRAALEFSGREAWIASAAMYLRAIRTFGPNDTVPDEITENFHEAVYQGADNKDFPLYLPFDSIERTEQPLGIVARGRWTLFNGEIPDARFALNQVKRLKPNYPEATLLEAEINMKEERFAEARQLLTILSADLSNPDWIRVLAEKFINQIPQ